jgi:MFS family permease
MLFWGGQSVSELGSAVTSIALPIVALVVLHASPLQVAVIAAAAQLPVLLFGLPAGMVVDRLSKRTIMIWSDLSRAVILASIPISYFTDGLSVWQLQVAAFLVATVDTVFDTTAMSYPPTLVPKSMLQDANSRLGVSGAAASFVGPALAGTLVSLLTAAGAVVVDCASYLLSAASLLLIRVREAGRGNGALRGPRDRGAVFAGIAHIWQSPILRSLTMCNASDSFFLAYINAIWLSYVVRGLHWTPQAAGIVLGVGASGGIVGGILANRFGRRFGLLRVLFIAETASLPGELATPFVPVGLAGQVAVAAGFFVLIFAAVIYNATQRTVRQLMTPSTLVGRVNAGARWLQRGFKPVASLLAGLIAASIGLRAAVVVGVAGMSLGTTILVFSPLRRLRTLPLS